MNEIERWALAHGNERPPGICVQLFGSFYWCWALVGLIQSSSANATSRLLREVPTCKRIACTRRMQISLSFVAKVRSKKLIIIIYVLCVRERARLGDTIKAAADPGVASSKYVRGRARSPESLRDDRRRRQQPLSGAPRLLCGSFWPNYEFSRRKWARAPSKENDTHLNSFTWLRDIHGASFTFLWWFVRSAPYHAALGARSQITIFWCRSCVLQHEWARANEHAEGRN